MWQGSQWFLGSTFLKPLRILPKPTVHSLYTLRLSLPALNQRPALEELCSKIIARYLYQGYYTDPIRIQVTQILHSDPDPGAGSESKEIKVDLYFFVSWYALKKNV